MFTLEDEKWRERIDSIKAVAPFLEKCHKRWFFFSSNPSK